MHGGGGGSRGEGDDEKRPEEKIHDETRMVDNTTSTFSFHPLVAITAIVSSST